MDDDSLNVLLEMFDQLGMKMIGNIRVINRHSSQDKSNDPLKAIKVYVGRPSPLGNPYPVPQYSRETSVGYFASTFYVNPYPYKFTEEGKEKYKQLDTIFELLVTGNTVLLECYCHPLMCHADVIKAFLISMTNGYVKGLKDSLKTRHAMGSESSKG